ncbi:hypothetical protein ES332_A10G223200v1 [Gossypium tomentosum]|uniref:Nudix hydrolase domain-containing protein n=1 Tax=Gossypium tomentosum TaxID=34277 RepID=A0A5D2NWE6_GOSTO|nr:hypothetical protein ES332_A10G223200v1 [Gossypium tomentosum]
MSDLVARTGRLQQRCIPFRYRSTNEADDVKFGKVVEVLMINSTSGPGLLFPKDFIGFYHFKSKSHQDEFSPEGLCKAAMFALFVKEELNSWPEQSTRTRNWLTIPKALQSCRHEWMKDALENGFCKWLAQNK